MVDPAVRGRSALFVASMVGVLMLVTTTLPRLIV
jgi:hypothetical protein